MNVAVDSRQRKLADRFRRSRRHGLREACCGDDRHCIVLFVRRCDDDLAVDLEVIDDSRAVQTFDIPTRQVDEVARADFYGEHEIVIKLERSGEADRPLLRSLRWTALRKRKPAFCHHHVHLVKEVHAPVKNHAAALCLRVSPVARDTAGTMNTGLNGENTTELA